MKKRMTCAALILALCLGLCPAFGAGTAEEKFPAKNTYPGYADVKESDWFYPNAKLCYETGLMTGTDVGFEPNKGLTNAECVTLAARLGAALRGEAIRPAQEGEPWWEPYREYRFPNGGGGVGHEGATRWSFLFMLYLYVYEAELLEPINAIPSLPDSDEDMVLAFYNAGILTGTDKYGSFQGGKGLTRAEAAAMLSRVIRSELRQRFVPADHAMFKAAGMTPYTGLFPGVEAEAFLTEVNAQIARWEAALGDDFNWHTEAEDGKTVLRHVKADTLTALGVSERDGVQSYKDFDVQVYYSRLIDLRGGPLERTGAPKAAESAPREYTLTEIALPEGWSPPGGDFAAADSWAAIERTEDGRSVEQAVYRASDGAILGLDGYSVYVADSPNSMGNATRFLVRRFDAQRDELLYNVFDVEQGRLLLDVPVLDTDTEDWKERIDPCFPKSDRPHPTRDEATGLYGYQDEAGNWAVPARYSVMWYLGDGVFTYWGNNHENNEWWTDCGIVTLDGVETPTETFISCFNGGLFANHGLIATGRQQGWKSVMNYYDYAGNRVSEDFDWAGPIGDDGAGFVGKDGGLYRIQF